MTAFEARAIRHTMDRLRNAVSTREMLRQTLAGKANPSALEERILQFTLMIAREFDYLDALLRPDLHLAPGEA